MGADATHRPSGVRPGTVFAVAFAELLAHPDVVESSSSSPRASGFLALHGGLEPGTAEIAVDAARRTGASWYVIRQPDELKRHVPSHEHDPADAPLLAAFLDHVDVVISVHGYWGHADARAAGRGPRPRASRPQLGGRLRARAARLRASSTTSTRSRAGSAASIPATR